MKLNWFSPLPPAQSGIADYAFALLPHLAQEAELVLWTNQTKWNKELENYGKVIPYQDQNLPWSMVHEADLNIYNIGNNPLFHKEIWEISRRCSGLVIIHDTKLLHFFTELYRHYYQDQQGYLNQIRTFYDLKAMQFANAIWDGHIDIDFMVDDYPLTPLALKNAIAGIVHNQQAYQDLKGQTSQLLAYLPLSYKSVSQLPKLQPKKTTFPCKLIIFGFLGKNRRLEPFLRAFASFKGKDEFELTICGKLEQEDQVIALIRGLNLQDQVTIKGFLSEEALEEALQKADLAINLRYPTVGEASISQLRIWSHGLPSLVTRTGWYSQLPENTVAFVEPQKEIEDIQKHLQHFLDNPDFFRKMGQEGRKFLEKQHTTEVYVQGLLTVAQKACELRHRSLVDTFSGMVGAQLSQWQTFQTNSLKIDQISEALSFFVSSHQFPKS
ncbi:MAG: glycosyltransferase family 4 protein [Microcystaceae cyanobacterium]